MPTEYSNYIDGDWCLSGSGETFEVYNPADSNKVVAQYQASTSKDVETAIEAAVKTQDSWAETPGPERGRILKDTAAALDERKNELAKALTEEEGKTRSEAAGEVQRAIDLFFYYAEKARELSGISKSPSGPNSELYTKREPLGTVGLITPWNYPVAIPAWKLAPALATGNTAVLKPASAAPGGARLLFECLDDAGLPDGVANFVTGSGSAVGSPLVEHDDIDGVSFTGSTSVGTRVADAASEDMKRVQCEMGGKNPTVVMPSADLNDAVDIVGGGAFGVTGQACTACSRAIVHERVYDEFVEKIVEYAESLEVGPGAMDPDMGPHVTADELSSTLEYISIGENDGALLETGGERISGDGYDSGYFVEPTVFSAVESDMRIAQEEIFGPVLSVISAADFEEALDVANDVDYGLSASIVTQDITEANRFIESIEAGVAKVNEKTTGLELHVPFGGYKASSTNTYREQGDAGIDFFTSTKTVYKSY